MKTALITGITGQDGAYLARLLIDKGYRVVGAARRNSSNNLWRFRWLGIDDDELEIVPLELLEDSNIRCVIEEVKPDEIYNLAAQSFVANSYGMPVYTGDVNALGAARLLEAIRSVNREIKFYQASTSEMFGSSKAHQNENTPFRPQSPYATAKLYAHWMTIHYREAYGIHACSGILFNHESPLRGSEFVTQKIAQGLTKIKAGKKDILFLGNLEAKRDWGFAGDYVEAMWLMLQQEAPKDYVIATGTMCSVRSFVGIVADEIGLPLQWSGDVGLSNGKPIVKVSSQLYRPTDVELLCGDATLASTHLGWTPTTTLPALATMMAKAAYEQSTQGR